MPSIQDLQPFISEPREDLSAEYKAWIDLTVTEGKATLAKAAIALANHGGGFIIIGMSENGDELQSVQRPAEIPEITQDMVNSAVRRFATPEFHCEVYSVPHPQSQVAHPVISVPGDLTEPVMSKRDCEGVLAQNKCYIRKPGPRSEEPQTGEEWRTLLSRCVRAGRDDMLEAIRSIVSGRVELENPQPNAAEELQAFCEAAHTRWEELIADEPDRSPAVFPHGYYEMGFSLVGAEPQDNLADLRERLGEARRIRLTGWTPFLEMTTPGWSPYPHEDFIEAWVGRPVREDHLEREPAHCDFWRASKEGQLYTIRGYSEDSLEGRPTGQLFDVTMPVWRIGEGVLFAARLANAFEGTEQVAVYCRYTGLDGRQLVSVTGNRALFGDDVSGTDELALSIQATPQQIQDNLAEVMHQLLTPLYERFNFWQLAMPLVEQELDRLRGGRF